MIGVDQYMDIKELGLRVDQCNLTGPPQNQGGQFCCA